jgi:hypothetical protein
VVIPKWIRAREDGDVQLIVSPHAARPPLGAAVIGVAVGSVLLAGGLFLAWLAIATPVLSALAPTVPRPSPNQLAVGGAVWAVTLVAPPAFAIVGVLRISRVLRALTVKAKPRAVGRIAALVGDEYVAATNVRMPDGRVVHDLVLGPFGLAIINELPPPRATRHAGSTWEIRGPDRRWLPMENPMERASRDSERVRRWFGAVERDYLVKTYAAVVTSDPSVARTPTCAVVTPEQIPAWLASLPLARALTPDRRAELVEEIRALV